MPAIVSKLPNDLEDVRHILPFWFNYLYWFVVILGMAVVLSLGIYLTSRLIQYLQAQKAVENFASVTAGKRRYSKGELIRDLKIIMTSTLNNKAYRLGLHRMAAVLRKYFEILLGKDIEEMTAHEILTQVQEQKELGKFFTELSLIQFAATAPNRKLFMQYYKKGLELVNLIRQ